MDENQFKTIDHKLNLLLAISFEDIMLAHYEQSIAAPDGALHHLASDEKVKAFFAQFEHTEE